MGAIFFAGANGVSFHFMKAANTLLAGGYATNRSFGG